MQGKRDDTAIEQSGLVRAGAGAGIDRKGRKRSRLQRQAQGGADWNGGAQSPHGHDARTGRRSIADTQVALRQRQGAAVGRHLGKHGAKVVRGGIRIDMELGRYAADKPQRRGKRRRGVAGDVGPSIERAAVLRRALGNLDDDDREIILWRHFEQLSNADVARLLGIREPAASKRYVRALERLRALLVELGVGPTDG